MLLNRPVRAHNINASANKAAFVQVMGTVVKAGGVRLLEVSKQYECQNSKCRYEHVCMYVCISVC